MSSAQNTLIYIEEKDKNEARLMAKGFADKNVRNRVYINVLGAELAGKYLASEGIGISTIDNLHNIRKILEEIDISDVILPRTHIDVRVVFDENYIFIPKSHFDLNILPHIYFVFQPDKQFTHVKFLGFFEPAMINKNNQNKDYYFIEKEKLSPVENLKNYLESATTSARTEMSDEELKNFEESIIDLVDNDIEILDKKILLKVLTKNQDLRNKFIEFENFELISYRAATEHDIQDAEEDYSNNSNNDFVEAVDEFEIFEKNDENYKNLSQTEDVITSNMCDDIIGENLTDNSDNRD